MIDGLASALKETANEVTKSVKNIMPDFFKDMEYNKDVDVNSPVDVKNKDLNSHKDLKTKNPLDGESTDSRFDNDNKNNNSEKTFVDEAEKTDADEKNKKIGGAYKDLPNNGGENHHMPADSTTDIPRGDGPAINMDKTDHRQTASCGSSKEAKEYRAKQKELIDSGKFKEAQQMDIDDIRSKFGDKYDDAIKEMEEYTDKLLEKRGVK